MQKDQKEGAYIAPLLRKVLAVGTFMGRWIEGPEKEIDFEKALGFSNLTQNTTFETGTK